MDLAKVAQVISFFRKAKYRRGDLLLPVTHLGPFDFCLHAPATLVRSGHQQLYHTRSSDLKAFHFSKSENNTLYRREEGYIRNKPFLYILELHSLSGVISRWNHGNGTIYENHMFYFKYLPKAFFH